LNESARQQRNQAMSPHAYWITPAGLVVCPAIRHIGTVLCCPEAFGETDATIKATCLRHGEQVSATFEGKARNEILARVIQRGFIRIRKEMTRRSQHWSIQYHLLTPMHHVALSNWAAYVLTTGLDPLADVLLHCLRDTTTTAMSLRELAATNLTSAPELVVLSENAFCAGSNPLAARIKE